MLITALQQSDSVIYTYIYIYFFLYFFGYSEREWKMLYNPITIIFYDSMIHFIQGILVVRIEKSFLFPDELDSLYGVESLAFLEVFNHKQDHFWQIDYRGHSGVLKYGPQFINLRIT